MIKKVFFCFLVLFVFSGCGGGVDGRTAEEWKVEYERVITDGLTAADRHYREEIEHTLTRQECLSYGYSPTRLHTCPGDHTADDFDYLCNNKYTDGYADCMSDFGVSAGDKLKKTLGEEIEEWRRSVISNQ